MLLQANMMDEPLHLQGQISVLAHIIRHSPDPDGIFSNTNPPPSDARQHAADEGSAIGQGQPAAQPASPPSSAVPADGTLTEHTAAPPDGAPTEQAYADDKCSPSMDYAEAAAVQEADPDQSKDSADASLPQNQAHHSRATSSAAAGDPPAIAVSAGLPPAADSMPASVAAAAAAAAREAVLDSGSPSALPHAAEQTTAEPATSPQATEAPDAAEPAGPAVSLCTSPKALPSEQPSTAAQLWESQTAQGADPEADSRGRQGQDSGSGHSSRQADQCSQAEAEAGLESQPLVQPQSVRRSGRTRTASAAAEGAAEAAAEQTTCDQLQASKRGRAAQVLSNAY